MRDEIALIKGAAAGIGQLGLVVQDMKPAMAIYSYISTLSSLWGFILELIETRVYGLTLGMPEWLLTVGRLTGDVEAVDQRE